MKEQIDACNTCKHNKKGPFEEPCCCCDDECNKWEPVKSSTIEEKIKDCDTCKYTKKTVSEEPCCHCNKYYNKWEPVEDTTDTRSYNVGASDYSLHKIQPWDIWLEYNLNPWDADIIKRVLRCKKGESRVLDYEKIIHVAQERIRQLQADSN